MQEINVYMTVPKSATNSTCFSGSLWLVSSFPHYWLMTEVKIKPGKVAKWSRLKKKLQLWMQENNEWCNIHIWLSPSQQQVLPVVWAGTPPLRGHCRPDNFTKYQRPFWISACARNDDWTLTIRCTLYTDYKVINPMCSKLTWSSGIKNTAETYLQPHYGNGVFSRVYLSAGQR